MTDIEASCIGKVKHTEETAALAVKDVRKHSGKRKGHILEPYKCRHCPFWHIGNRSTKRQRNFLKARGATA